MHIQLNTDKNIKGTETLEEFVSDKIQQKLKHFADRITRVEVHLSDQNADKGGSDDIQCTIEARMEGLQPIVAESKSSSKEKALDEASNKIKAALTTAVGKLRNA